MTCVGSIRQTPGLASGGRGLSGFLEEGVSSVIPWRNPPLASKLSPGVVCWTTLVTVYVICDKLGLLPFCMAAFLCRSTFHAVAVRSNEHVTLQGLVTPLWITLAAAFWQHAQSS
jgi:hypothetical protein